MTTAQNRWGGARARSGATDTTMLIWKVIEANPGITRDGIFTKIEDQIPAGYARRRYQAKYKINADDRPVSSALILGRARRYLLTDQLRTMCQHKNITEDDGGYTVVRSITRYRGDASKVDETGDAAAEHLNAAYALKTLRSFRARAKSPTPRFNAAEYAAFLTLMEWAERRMRD